MSYRLEKYSPPVVTPPVAGSVTVNGGSFVVKTLSGFYPRNQWIEALNPGGVWLDPNLRLNVDLLSQDPPISQFFKDMLINMFYSNAGYSPFIEWVYVVTQFEVWEPNVTVVAPVPGFSTPTMFEGWNASGRTVQSFFGQVKFSFSRQVGNNIVVGLVDDNATDQNDPNAVLYGWRFNAPNNATPVEKGVAVGASFTGTTFTVRRRSNAVDYIADNTILVVTQLAPGDTARDFHGVATLYTPFSYVDGISIEGLSGGDGTLRALAGLGGRSTGQAINVLPRLRTTGGNFRGGVGRLPALVGLGGRVIGQGSARLPKMTTVAYDGRRPDGSGGVSRLRALRAVGLGKSGRVGQGVGVLPKLAGRSSIYSGGEGTLPRLRGAAFTDPVGEAFISSSAFYTDSIEAGRLILVTMDSNGSVTSVMSVALIRDAALDSSATVTTSAAVSMLLNAVMNSTVEGTSFEPLFQQGATTWVVNADTSASTSYENYPFNSYAVIDGKLYGAKDDGLFLLEGDDDAGLPILAQISFGDHDFKTTLLKRLESVYVHMSSTGTMTLKVKAQGNEYTYSTERSAEYMTPQRFIVGRGLRAAVIGFELVNDDGADFELERLLLQASELTRRLP